MKIPFNLPHITGKELKYIEEVVEKRHLSGNGVFTGKCQQWLEKNIGCAKAFLTTSCTSALELSAVLLNLGPGDEVIMPSYTFVSTANAFVMLGATPVFVDIRGDTLNIDERKIEKAITRKTRAIVAVHYSGVACNIHEIKRITKKHKLILIEDAAHALMAAYNNKPLGSFGELAALSFHETKNITSGEGGALLINDKRFIKRAKLVWEKGTDRHIFREGKADKYTWVDLGSSYMPSEIIAAFLYAQMKDASRITRKRLYLWNLYHKMFTDMERNKKLRRPVVPPGCEHNAHMYYLILPDKHRRDMLIASFKKKGIGCVFHYIPLHSSPAGKRFGRSAGKLPVTTDMSERIIRLPLWAGMSRKEIVSVINAVKKSL